MTTTPQPEIDLSAAAWIRDPDLRQDCILALLDQQPTSPEEAVKIVQRVRWTQQHRRRRDQRYRGTMPERESDGNDTYGRPAATPVTDAVQRLPEDLRKVMLMRFVGNLEVDEVADTLHVSVSTVKRMTQQAMKIIRNGEL